MSNKRIVLVKRDKVKQLRQRIHDRSWYLELITASPSSMRSDRWQGQVTIRQLRIASNFLNRLYDMLNRALVVENHDCLKNKVKINGDRIINMVTYYDNECPEQIVGVNLLCAIEDLAP